MSTSFIQTKDAPAAIGTYSQAVAAGDYVYLSGQIALDPITMEMQNQDIQSEIHQVFLNVQAVCRAAGGSLRNIIKITAYLTDLGDFAAVNDIMREYFTDPYPARAAVEVKALPKHAAFEVDAILYLPK